jgi:hypothetical protein
MHTGRWIYMHVVSKLALGIYPAYKRWHTVVAQRPTCELLFGGTAEAQGDSSPIGPVALLLFQHICSLVSAASTPCSR